MALRRGSRPYLLASPFPGGGHAARTRARIAVRGPLDQRSVLRVQWRHGKSGEEFNATEDTTMAKGTRGGGSRGGGSKGGGSKGGSGSKGGKGPAGWPSTTGNRSGGGRDNAPSKK